MPGSIDVFCKTEYQRIPAEELAQKLCEYDVISFDVFDTLILRPFTSPRVLFSMMEERLGIYKFSKIRVDSEDEIRRLNQEKYGHDNTTLYEIYDLIAKKTNLDTASTANLEYQLELDYCYTNPYFKKIVSLCMQRNKKIIICTDMYLSKEQIQGILNNAGYPCFDEIFVSSELQQSKKAGDIFNLLKDKYSHQRIIHVGDNYVSDVEHAESAGISTLYYRNANDIGRKYRIGGMSYITGRVYSAIINNHLYCDNVEYDEAYKLGYIYGGIYVLGFVQWVNRFADDHQIDKILFLSRDGDIYSRMYDKLPGHKEWEYFYWSRLAGMKITASENFYEFCQRMIWHKARGVYQIRIEHLLSFFGITHLTDKLHAYYLTKDDVMTKETAPMIESLFYDHKTEIIDSFRNDIDATLERVKEAVGDAKRIAIVDVGWAGTGPLILKKAINHYLKLDCKVYSLLVGYRQPIENMSALYTMDDTIHTYLFADTTNRDLMDQHMHYGTRQNNLLLEIFTQSCTPSFLGYTRQGLEFDWEETENYETIEKIHAGIEAFVSKYIDTFQNDPFILNISPYDAYLPFNELKNDSSRLNPILSDLVISRGKFYDAEKVSEETWLSFLYKDE